jgi:TolA-binding protein/peroxiredoxin
MKRSAMVLVMLGMFGAAPLKPATAATPSPEEALQLNPIQSNVEYDSPGAAEVAQCTLTAEKFDGKLGWVLKSPKGVVLRLFIDTNGDNIVDRWSYYQGGIEVYRDIDTDFNGKADQYRWFHTAGVRWGRDENEDGQIDRWKDISAEEVTAEVVAAIADQDVQRFARVSLSEEELENLGLGQQRTEEIAERIAEIEADFRQMVSSQKTQEVVGEDARWLQFSGNKPGVVPAGTEGSTKDLKAYENVIAVFESGDGHGQVQVGTLVEVDGGWRVVGLPQPITDSQEQLAASGIFFRASPAAPTAGAGSGPNERVQELLAEMEELDQAASQADPSELPQYNTKRADLLEQVAEASETAADRAMWIRQMADMISAAVQSGTYPDGAKRLQQLFDRLDKQSGDKDLAAYVKFRQLAADYGQQLMERDADYAELQEQWLKNLEQFVEEFPQSPDSAEAMLQLGMTEEFSGNEDEALQWYAEIVETFPESAQAKKAMGARTRLNSVGRQISLQGESLRDGKIDLQQYRGNVVLIQYWATWSKCQADMAIIKDLLEKYGKAGFKVIGVNVDSQAEEVKQFLSENAVPWPQIFEEGGLDSRPANELGILTVPTTILVDEQGKVIDRNVRVAELDDELKKLVR